MMRGKRVAEEFVSRTLLYTMNNAGALDPVHVSGIPASLEDASVMRTNTQWTPVVLLAGLVAFTASGSAAEPQYTAPYVEGLPRSLQQKLVGKPYPQFGAACWDIFDYPQKPKAALKLKNILRPDETVDVDAAFAGKVVVLAEIDVSRRISGEASGSGNTWTAREGVPLAVQAYKRLFDEYAQKGVTFIAVWRDTGRNAREEDAPKKAADYVAKHKLPGHVLLDAVGKGRSRSLYYDYADARIPGHNGGGTLVCVRNADGKLVYRGFERKCFGYHTTRLMLDRLLDAEFDKTVRRDFYPEKPHELPVVEKRPDGLAYVEKFESYADNHAFKLEPRWGFTYAKQSRLDLRPAISADGGRSGSKAAHVNAHATGSVYTTYGLQHRFPAPVTDGYVRFFIRRQPVSIAYREPETEAQRFRDVHRSLGIRFGQPGSYFPAGLLTAVGAWGKETFRMDFRIDVPGPVAMAKTDWQEVRVTCKPGRRAVLTIDGKLVGKLDSEAVDWIGFRQVANGKEFYVDDVEVFYRGNAADILAAHQAARPTEAQPIEPFTKEEERALHHRFEPTLVGTERTKLPEGAIPRADIGAWKHPYISMDHPIPIGPIVLEDMRNPGTFYNPIEKHKGKIIYVAKAGHMDEWYMRGRTINRSPTVFQRPDRLRREYRPKGIVAIGIGAADGGHRATVHTFIDRVMTGSESGLLTRSLMAELEAPRDHIIYGTFNDMLDEHAGEAFPNQTRIWKKVMRGKIIDGSFGGPGVDMILNKEGRIVWRSAGPDGNTYWRARTIFDRLLDDDFDIGFRQEFRNPDLPYYRSPLLPQQEVTAEGLAYRDDFESYKDSYEFGLHPRWGFTYTHSPSANTPAPTPGEGRGESKALFLNNLFRADVWCGNDQGAILSAGHTFPAPLTDGHFRFFMRRGSHVKYHGAPPLFRIAVTALDSAGKPMRTLTTQGDWKRERFVSTPTDAFLRKWNVYRYKTITSEEVTVTDIPMAENAWQEVRLVCKPGGKAAIFIDGKKALELASETVTGIELRSEVWAGTYIDDVELLYAGDGDTFVKQHAKALKADLARRQGMWKKEADAWEAKVARMTRSK
jgi:hypothetical protein